MSTEMDGLKRSRVLNSYKILAAHFVEKNSIEGGSKVRITREWERGENGCSCSFFPNDMSIGDEFTVEEEVLSYDNEILVRAGFSRTLHIPFFAIELISNAFIHKITIDDEDIKLTQVQYDYIISEIGKFN
tara:strand:- start:203 stop:595 length:393 start_codon:yes stop_codon:yes gene_type:complete